MNLSEGKRIGYLEIGQALRGGVWVSLGGQMTELTQAQAIQLGTRMLELAGCEVAHQGGNPALAEAVRRKS